MKKICALLIVLLVLSAQFKVLPAHADVQSGNFSYIVNPDNISVTITGYTDSAPRDHVVIPQSIDGKMVTAIGDGAFQRKSIQSLELPNGLVSIGEGAFVVNLLTSLEVPGSVKDIDDLAFADNELTSLTINDGVVRLGIGAFSGNQITNLVLPDSVAEINDRAFFGNILESLVLPNNLVEIGDSAFGSNRLTSIDIPASVKIIGSSAFDGNRILQLEIPSTVTTIEDRAFHYNALTSVTFLGIPALIGNDVFANQYLNGENSYLHAWYTDTAYTQAWNNIDTAPMTIYAAWDLNVIRFNPNGGSAVVPNQSIPFGQKGTEAAEIPTKTGHTFAGWYKEAEFINQWNFNTDIVIRNVTLYARWTANTYTVSFNTDGGSAVTGQTIAYDNKVVSPPAPTKPGYTFAGWYTDSSLSTPWNFGTGLVKGSMTLYAKWTANSYTVSFNADGGSAVAAQTIAYDDKVVSPPAPVKPGYTFAGWYTDSSLTTPWNFGTGLVKGSMTLYAKWTANSYTVSFNADGGSAVTGQTVSYDDKVVSPPAPTKPGYTFAGWYTDSSLTTPWNFDTGLVKGSMILYAKWTANSYTVSFDTDGGSAVTAQTIAYDDKVVSPPAPTKMGHTFADWYTDSNLTTPWNFDTGLVKGSMTLYAKWTANSYTVSFNADGGSAVIDQTIAYDDKVVSPPAPTKPGHTFAGWFKDEELTLAWNFTTDVVNADTTLYAKWTKNNIVVDPGPIIDPKPIPEPIPEEEPAQNCPTVFADISNHWAENAITDIASRCIIIGYPDGEFKPNAPLIRAHVAVMFGRALELSPNHPSSNYQDVSENNPYYEAILKVSQAGIFEGTNGYFYPYQQLTRAEMAKILVIAFNLPVDGKNTFQDVPETHWASSYIAALESYGIAFGEDGYYKPEEPVTRAEFVAFMYRALRLSSI